MNTTQDSNRTVWLMTSTWYDPDSDNTDYDDEIGSDTFVFRDRTNALHYADVCITNMLECYMETNPNAHIVPGHDGFIIYSDKTADDCEDYLLGCVIVTEHLVLSTPPDFTPVEPFYFNIKRMTKEVKDLTFVESLPF